MGNNFYDAKIHQLRQFPTKFLILHLLIGLVWITTSDQIVEVFVEGAESLSFVQSLKGWLYVFVTGMFFYYYLTKETKRNINFYQKLQDNEEEIMLTNEAFNNLDQGLIITDENGYVLKVNKQFEDMVNLPVDEIIGERYERVLQFETKDSYRKIRRQLESEGHWEDEVFMEDGSGNVMPRYFTMHKVLDEHGKLTNYFGFLVDIKETKQKDQILHVTRNQLHGILEHSPLGIIAINRKGLINVWNGQAEEILGISKQDALNQPITNVKPILLQGASTYLASEGDIYKQHREVKHTGGQSKYLQLTYSNLYNQDGKLIGMQVMVSDFTTEREFKREINYLEHFDYITGLYNFNTFNEEAARKIEQNKEQEHAFMILDIDRFHSINQQYGTEFGDEVILSIAKTIKQVVKSRGIIARLKGDEFGILISNVNNYADIKELLQTLKNELNQPTTIRDEIIHPTISIGIAYYPQDDHDFEGIYQKANAALKNAKVDRETYSFYEPSMNDHLEHYFYENELHRAILNEEIELHYQPKIDMKTGSIQGLEALARWYHPEKGTISPGVFIPIAEETGLIFSMTDYVLKRACADYVKWRDEGIHIPSFSVNISAKQFSKREFVSNVLEILEDYQIPAGVLEIEITESITMNIDNNMPKLNQLREAGVMISIDDFGTGYSSLRYMRDLPVDFVKIDRSFISMIGQSDGKNMVDFMVDLAKLCEIDIVGEGIETSDQMNYLLSIGCRIGQGFYFARPMPFEEVQQLYVTH
ncbi:sensor domain-containing protein [Aquisalibacillus elongatus]|uniref:PAS domain S-box-containing protein/diguanylate cyclase (GGDEF)-like protein n=1 Tax=Aquisalibacillus elongatus TaxID=485577 RepID=A0A3N5AZD9_9BACI|nr:EAL domain-containing protein [Aquisalibacillus elongatus]RPF50367.1 PAS domain S-box-containing protein/diguanylate cyclase (GGDEF)-like protein [Aquisalibacillus elongatus]